jgi:hypothetical protein
MDSLKNQAPGQPSASLIPVDMSSSDSVIIAPGQKAKFNGYDDEEPQNQVSKWDAAKKGMANSWFLGIPFGLAVTGFSHFLAKDADPVHNCQECKKTFGPKGAILFNVGTSVLGSVISWALTGGLIGAISASRANHNAKKADNQDDSKEPADSHKAFMWGAGAYGLYLSATSALSSMGVFGENIKKYTRTIYTSPKLLIPSLAMGVASCIASGYVAMKMTPWIQQKQSNQTKE